MIIALIPKTPFGKGAALLSTAFIVLIIFKVRSHIPLPTFAIAVLGITGFIAGVISTIKKDRSIGSLFSILVGLVIILWVLGELIYPH